jgi:hypothetical protein
MKGDDMREIEIAPLEEVARVCTWLPGSTPRIVAQEASRPIGVAASKEEAPCPNSEEGGRL